MGNNKKIAIVLAAGYSSRMHKFKPTLEVEGKPAVQGIIDEIKKTEIDRILLVTGYKREELKPFVGGIVEEVYNEDFDEGMISSVRAALKSMMPKKNIKRGPRFKLNRTVIDSYTIMEANEEIKQQEIINGVFIFPVDIPLIKADVIQKLIEESIEDLKEKKEIDASIIVPTYKGKKGHPLYLPKRLFGEAISKKGKQGLNKITYDNFLGVKFIEVNDERVILDMDTEEDYKKILEYKQQKKREKDIKELAKGRKFILFRHGSIVPSKGKIFLGQTDRPMSNAGRQEVKSAASTLKTYEFKTNTVYTSPLLRAKMTADILKQELQIEEIVLIDQFKEISLGEWDGELISKIKRKYPYEYRLRGRHILRYKPPGQSENFYDLRYRVEKGLREILENDKKKDIIIVSHKGVIKILEEILTDSEMTENVEMFEFRKKETRRRHFEKREELLEWNKVEEKISDSKWSPQTQEEIESRRKRANINEPQDEKILANEKADTQKDDRIIEEVEKETSDEKEKMMSSQVECGQYMIITCDERNKTENQV